MDEKYIVIKKDEVHADDAEGIIVAVGVAIGFALWGWAKGKGAKKQ